MIHQYSNDDKHFDISHMLFIILVTLQFQMKPYGLKTFRPILRLIIQSYPKLMKRVEEVMPLQFT